MSASELRKDLVSGEWILVARGRRKRPHEFVKQSIAESVGAEGCPFETSHINGMSPVAWYARPGAQNDVLEEWFVQAIPNKFPALAPHKQSSCPLRTSHGIYTYMPGVGYHEVIVTRPHERSWGQMTQKETELVIRAYRDRYTALQKDACVTYILIFHNHGAQAGASIAHPHSQMVALPIIPPDVERSLRGSRRFYEENHSCIHCYMIDWERKTNERIIYENEAFLVMAPYASHVSLEVRVYPKEHNPHFELITERQIPFFAEAMVTTLSRLYKALNDPPYNFFIHTAPANQDSIEHYHWHAEILPKIAVSAGLELGTGMDVVVVAPEDVPQILGA